jgi:phage baseplate assembly protein W
MANITTADRYTITRRTDERYSDIQVNLDIHPGKKDLLRLTDEQSIKRSIVNLLMTDYHERLYQPMIGANLKYLLFEPADSETLMLLREQIILAIKRSEPRANITEIVLQLTPDETGINVTLSFTTIKTPTPVTLTVLLNRVR